jgi:hypothetical protein
MRREKAAELILSLVTPEEIAIPTVGDLAEEASLRGGASFWPDVGRTFASQLWRDLYSCPIRLALLSLSGLPLIPIWGYLLLLIVVLPVAGIIALLQLVGIMHVVHIGAHTTIGPMMLAGTAPWTNWLFAFMTYAISPLFVGYHLAERSGGREIAVALSNVTFSRVLGLLGLFVFTPNFHRVGGGLMPFHPISDLFLITGAILCRFRWLGLQRQARQQSEPAAA